MNPHHIQLNMVVVILKDTRNLYHCFCGEIAALSSPCSPIGDAMISLFIGRRADDVR